ncbi:MAG: GCN5-related N-acetyltransferase [uncultured bacterium]|nr:MAG: GCN5-related N-acetyltransferase [uncultured bacterium]
MVSEAMRIEYRNPNSEDLAAVMALMPSLYSEIGEGLQSVLEEFIKDNHYFKLLATNKETGVDKGFMVGCCRLEVDFECRAGIIEEIVVSPDRRGLGIGKTMLEIFEAWSKERGAKGILVPCGREGFYEKVGFEMFPVKRYWKDLQADKRTD